MAELFDVTSAGYLREYLYAVPGTFGITSAPTLAQIASVRTTGVYPVKMNGTRGMIDASFTVGAPGAAQAVAFLVDRVPVPTRFLGIGVDATNRPVAYLQDVNGTSVGVFALGDAALIAGTKVHVVLSWNAAGTIDRLRYAAVRSNGDLEWSNWTTPPTASWTPFTPAMLIVGSTEGASFQSLGSFNGTIQRIVVLTTLVSSTAAEAGTYNVLAGDTMAASDTIRFNYYTLSDTASILDSVTTQKN